MSNLTRLIVGIIIIAAAVFVFLTLLPAIVTGIGDSIIERASDAPADNTTRP